MTSTSSPDSLDLHHAVLGSIVSYLEELSAGGEAAQLGSDAQEALEVATQCLAGLVPAEKEKPKQPLINIFTAGLEAISTASNKADLKEETDERFPKWVAKLAEKGYFHGAEEGSDEYSLRLSKAWKKWKEKREPTQVAVDTATAENCKTLGNTCLAQGQVSEAISHYSNAIRHNPDETIYYANRATAYMKLGQLERAVEDCRASIRLDPTYTKAHFRLGVCLVQLEQSEEAIASLQRALETCADQQSPIACDIRNKLRDVQQQQQPTQQQPQAGAFNLESMMDTPVFQNMAEQMMQNPDMMAWMKGGMGAPASSQASASASAAPTASASSGGNPLAALMDPAKLNEMLDSPQVAELEKDPEMAPVIAAVRSNGPMGALSYLGDPAVMSKLQQTFMSMSQSP